MKILVNICVGVGILSLILAIVARVMGVPIPVLNGISARALLNFTNSTLLLAIALILLKTKSI